MDDSKIKIPAYLKISKVITYALYAWVIFGIIILGIRVFMLAFSANPATPFVHFIYNTSDTFLAPFRGIFPAKQISDSGYLDIAAIFAMIIYALIGWGFSALIDYIQHKIDMFKAAAKLEAAKAEAERQATLEREDRQAALAAPQRTRTSTSASSTRPRQATVSQYRKPRT